jgi:hypothetical protein
MKTATKVSAYAVALAVVFGGTWAAGAATGPVRTGPAQSMGHEEDMRMGHDDVLPGLSAAANGYQLDVSRTTVTTGAPTQFTFRVLGPDGTAVKAFDTEHEKQLHFIVVRRDGSGYQHLHPVMATDGVWTVPLRLEAAGSYRLFADFAPTGGTPTTLGTDIQAARAYNPAPDTGPVRTATVDGYDVTLSGDLRAGKSSTVIATVTRNGQATELEPYLGAYGHLVALRASDLGYLHVHPLAKTGPEVRFAVEVPTAGRYRLYLDFQHGGVVRNATFTVDTGR